MDGDGKTRVKLTDDEGNVLIDTDSETLAKAAKAHKAGGIAADQLRSYIERIERVEAEKRDLGADITEIYAEAKGNGFDPKVMRHIIKLRRMGADERAEFEALVDTYQHALDL